MLQRTLLLAVFGLAGCKSPPPPTEGTGTTTASATTSAATTTTATTATTPANDCAKLKKDVLGEAEKLASCKVDADCKVHRIPVCDFHELGCYAAHVNTSADTAKLDKAISAYAATCSLTKCKCEMPEKSVCKAGACTGE
jgi:hypothetical protein